MSRSLLPLLLGDAALEVLQYVLVGALGLLILFFLAKALLSFLANFTGWAKWLLDALAALWAAFQWRPRPKVHVLEEVPGPPPPPPFSSFRDPFRSGVADRMTPEAAVRYTFAALEAWAHERGLGRRPGETPLEFMRRIGNEYPALADEARALGDHYAGLAYAGRRLGAECFGPLRSLWALLSEVGQPVAAAT
jgi:hypothetical protein